MVSIPEKNILVAEEIELSPEAYRFQNHFISASKISYHGSKQTCAREHHGQNLLHRPNRDTDRHPRWKGYIIITSSRIGILSETQQNSFPHTNVAIPRCRYAHTSSRFVSPILHDVTGSGKNRQLIRTTVTADRSNGFRRRISHQYAAKFSGKM